MPRFSANLGFLWNDLPLADAIYAAAKAGFDAVECHWPYDQDLRAAKTALKRTGMPMLSLNTLPGEHFGLSAIAGEQAQARQAIRLAVDTALDLGARAVHVMAGKAQGPQAEQCFRQALAYACDYAHGTDVDILIEPINSHDVPGYFLHDLDQALAIVTQLDRPELALMFDCYHIARSNEAGGNNDKNDRTQEVQAQLSRALPHIGHIQFAGVPDRHEPHLGELDYGALFEFLDASGWTLPLGAEYRPQSTVEAGLAWLQDCGEPPAN